MARDGGVNKGDIFFVLKRPVYQFDKTCNQPEIVLDMAGKIDDSGAIFACKSAHGVYIDFAVALQWGS